MYNVNRTFTRSRCKQSALRGQKTWNRVFPGVQIPITRIKAPCDVLVDPSGTSRRNVEEKFYSFAVEQIKFLKGQDVSANGVMPPSTPFCMKAIRLILGVSLDFMYTKRRKRNFISIVDASGVRERQTRNFGSRRGYPLLSEFPSYDCGCDDPCLSNVPVSHCEAEYRTFSKICKESDSRRKENMSLLKVMWSPITNSIVPACNVSIYAFNA